MEGVRQFVPERFHSLLSSRTCLNYLHRLGFVVKRPKKRLFKANADKRAAFASEYAALRSEAQKKGAKIFCVDEAHFRADVDLRSQWVLRGQPAPVDSTSPRFGEKATYYSAVWLETGEVHAMPVERNPNAETSVTFLKQLRELYSEPLIVIWDNGPAHRGDAMRAYLTPCILSLGWGIRTVVNARINDRPVDWASNVLAKTGRVDRTPALVAAERTCV